MNQKQLQYFVTVYQTQNIKTAADTLYVSRQGVSKVIRMLEEELGQPLFIRSIKGVIPTDYATTLLPHAKSLLEEYDAIRSLRTLAAKSQSVVTIYALDHVLAYLGASLIEDFSRRLPDRRLPRGLSFYHSKCSRYDRCPCYSCIGIAAVQLCHHGGTTG